MRTQSETSGVGARGTYADLQQYDQKLKPSPLVPRKQLKKESSMNEAFVRGFLDELEKKGQLGGLISKGVAALKGAGGLKGLGRKALSYGKTQLKDPSTQFLVGQQIMGGIQNRRQNRSEARQQQQAALSGRAPVTAKKPVGLMGGLGFGGAV